jgi:hypothetical protein
VASLRWYLGVAAATLGATLAAVACERHVLDVAPRLAGANAGSHLGAGLVPVRPAGAAVPERTAEPIGAEATLARIAPVVARQDDGGCPAGMLPVEGEYCPNVQHQCRDYLDPKGRYEFFRCREYVQPARCLSARREHKRFCIDRTEYVAPGESLPANDQSWTAGERVCRSLGKRLCTESEWNFACEGEEMRPYPYGWKRDPGACNADHTDLVDAEGKLKDRRAPAGAHPRCASPFGVLDLAGNLEEFVTLDATTPPRPAMKGAYWQPSRNFCRAAQTAHDAWYHGTETGFRCCSDLD